ncbi:MAG: insulinase family protein [Bacteroidetes bacterium]|nr:insulinase family protein [Bacteroidota bacterium]
MLSKKIFFVFGCVASSILVVAQTSVLKPVEKIVKKTDELVIPYEKFILNNGLTVLIHEDHSDPVVHVDVTYHVGSNREQEGRSGFAHFFEHMMFQGSDHVADEEHFKLLSEAGGTLNGTTSNDRTNYFETVPSNHLELALWLEADRMGFLLDAVTQQKFEIQRATVKNERGQNYDNRPYGLINEKTNEALYPKGHPYSWPTIGYIEDLNRVGVDDLKRFFLRWYGPNNAVLTIAGDVNTQDALKQVEKYFGVINKGPEVKKMPKMPVTLDKSRYIAYEDNIRFPMVRLTYPTVPNFHEDEAPLDVLSNILGGDKNSIFYQTFVKSQYAIQANVMNPCSELSGEFNATVLVFPDKSLVEAEKMIQKCFEEFEKRGVTDEDLIKYKAHYESYLVNTLSSVSGKATSLANYYIKAGDANYIQKDYARYMKVTKEDVMRVYSKYIKNKPAVVLSVCPKGKLDMAVQTSNYTVPSRDVSVAESDEYKNLTYKKPVDVFDRSKKPAAKASPVVTVPDYWTENFPNGLKLIGVKSDEVPSVTLKLSIEAGHRQEDLSKAGLAQITADLLNESTTKRSAEEIAQELDKLGSSVDVSAGTDDITITITSLTKNIDATLKVAEEILFQPKFDEKEFERSKKQMLEAIANQATQPTTIANNVYAKLLYGHDHILGVPTLGTAKTVGSITLEDVKQYYTNKFSPSISKLVVVGDISKELTLAKLAFLKNWKAKTVENAKPVNAPAVDKTRLYFVNKEKAAQSEIRMGYFAMPYDATGEYYKSQLMNFVLGGTFNSRLNLNLREAKGYTYGARSYFSGNKSFGQYSASAGVKTDVTDSAVVEFLKEIKNYADKGITDIELDYMRKSATQGEALKYESPSDKAAFLKKIIEYNLDKGYTKKQSEIASTISKEEINALAKKNLKYNNMYMLVVGDKNKVYDKLTKLGYEVIELDTEGNPTTKIDTTTPASELDKKIKD